jgi:hypothetical protein
MSPQEEFVMSLSDSMRNSTLSYLYGLMDMKKLRLALMPLALDAGDSRESEALRIANQLLGDFADLDSGYLSERDFKQNLMNLLFGQSISKYMELQLNQFSPQPGTCTGTSTSVGTGSFELAGTGLAMVFA